MCSKTSTAFERISAALDRLADLRPEQWEGAVAQLLSDEGERERALRLAREELLDDGDLSPLGGAASAGRAFPQLIATMGSDRRDDQLPNSIGEFRIVERLGTGGMGEVFLAERTRDGFTQRVALKRVRLDALGSGASRARARFLSERELLAGLEHPGIARFIDAGEEADGALFYAMEYVDGSPITSMCDDLHLTVAERVEVFCSVCEAVSAAHRHLVLHRDLKPSNILMTRSAEVKLVDFGIAKMLEDEASGEETGATATRAFTPEYAAPEQHLGLPTSTATDVYGLGLVLYELLVGVGAHRASPTDGSIEERLERRATPPRVAWSVVTEELGGDELKRIARGRASTLEQIEREFRGDLANIVGKALRTEPGERYPSAEALRADLENYLAHRPVEATRGNLAYRLRKLVQRHRASAALLTAAAVMVLVGVIGTVTQAQKAARERDRARQAEAEAQAVNRFLLDDLIGSFSPEVAQASEVTLRQLTDLAAARLDESVDQSPGIRRGLRLRLAEMYLEQGDAEGMARQLGKAGELPRPSSEATWRLPLLEARLALLRDEYQLASDLLAELPEDRSQTSSDERSSHLADEVALLSAELAWRSGDWTGAERDLRSFHEVVVKRRPRDQELELRVKQQLHRALAEQRRSPEALALARQVFAGQTALYGRRHPAVITTACGLTPLYLRAERDAEALANAIESLAVADDVLGHEHPARLECLNYLGWAHAENGAHEDALARYAEIEEIATRTQGPRSRRAVTAAMNQGVMYARQGRYTDAVPFYRRATEGYLELYGVSNPATVRSLRNYESALRRLGREREANEIVEQLIAVGHQRATEDPIDATLLADFALNLAQRFPEPYRDLETARRYAELAREASAGRSFLALSALARIARLQGDLETAMSVLERAAPLPAALYTYSFEVAVVDVGVELGSIERAEAILRSILQRRLEQRPAEDPIAATTHRRLSELYQRSGRLDQALEQAQSGVRHMSRCCSPDHRFAGLAVLQLGRVLTDLERFDEAERNLQRAGVIFEENPLAIERDRQAVRDALEGLALRRTAVAEP